MGLKMPRSAMIKESLLSVLGQTFVLLLCDRAGWWRLVAVGRWMRHECYGGDGKQPERLNAEGFSPSAFSRGLSVSATPGTVAAPGKASEGRESCRQ